MDFLKEVEKKLDLPLAEKEQVMRELETHYSDLRDEYLASGMSECEANEEAACKLGDPADVAQKMQSVHCQVGWKTAFMMALPLIVLRCFGLLRMNTLFIKVGVLALAAGAAYLAITAVFLYPSIRDWRAGKRPVWLATWMAMGVSAFLSALLMAVRYLSLRQPALMQTSMTLLNLLSLIVWGIFAAWLLKELPRWRSFVGAVATIAVFAVSASYLWFWPRAMGHQFLITLFCLSAIHVAAGIGAFGRRPYGNAAQASLFIWVAHGVSSVVMAGASSSPVIWSIFSAIAVVATVFAYARQDSWLRKIYVTGSAILVLFFVSVVSIYEMSPYNGSLMKYSSVVAYQGLFLVWNLFIVVVVPVLYDMRQSRQRPQTV